MLFAIAVILILIADQGLKYWVTLSIPLDDGVRALFPGFLELRNIHNTGAAFSLLAGAPRWIFIILAVIFIVIIVLAVRREWVHPGVQHRGRLHRHRRDRVLPARAAL